MTTPSVTKDGQFDLSKIRIRKTEWHEVPQVGDLLVDGFHDCPIWCAIDLHDAHPGAEKYIFERRARFLFESSYLILYEDEIVGHFSVETDITDVPGTGLWTLIWNGVWLVPILYGVDVTRKFMELADTYDAEMKPVFAAHGPFDLLNALVIKTEWRGHRIGQYVMEKYVMPKRDKMFLTTQLASNVRFYERLGFKVVDHRKVKSELAREYETWAMEYTPPLTP